jgi:hypothetical protein
MIMGAFISGLKVVLPALLLVAAPSLEAARGGGHGGHAGGARATAHTSVNRPAARPQANRNVNRNVNRNINRDIDIDVHHDHGGWNDWDDHPFATAAAVTAGVAVTSAVIGSIVNTVPPGCVTTVVNGIAYQQCGTTWYQPQYAGTNVQYVVINPPY